MTGWIVETLAASTLLMLLVLIIRQPVAQAFGPRIGYLLWLLPALRMVLPPLPAEMGMATPIAALPVMIDLSLIETASAATAAAPAVVPVDWPALLLAIWLGGAAMHFAWHLYCYRRFVGSVLARAEQLPRLDRGGVEVCASKAVRGPFAAGVFRKTIVLPHDYRSRYSADELRLALSHETVHHLRCDMSANLVALGMLSLHWFNPVAWRAHRAFRIDQELACDAIVLADASAAERHAYGSALLKSTCDRLPVAACALGAGDLKRRLRMMGLKQRSRAQLRTGVALAAVLVSGGLVVTASGGLAAETTRNVKEQVQATVVEKAETAVAAIAPIAPQPIRAAFAVEAPPAPVAPPAPPAPAFHPHPPAAPEAPGAIDHEAMSDAMEAAAGAREEAMEAAVEARAEAMAKAHEKGWPTGHAEIAPEKLRVMRTYAYSYGPKVVRTRCGTSDQPVISKHETGPDGKKREVLIMCTNFQPMTPKEVAKIQIDALRGAREAIAEMDDDQMNGEGRRNALASLDRRIAELKKQR